MLVRKFKDKMPEIDESVFLAENCVVIGDVKIEKDANIWYGAVIRGDENRIEIGEGANIQDNATVHTNPGLVTRIGSGVTVGHNAIVHGCTVGENSMIGMGACVMNGAVIGKNCIVAAGALVTEKSVIPDGSLCVGVPAKVIKQISAEQAKMVRLNGEMYVELAKLYGEE